MVPREGIGLQTQVLPGRVGATALYTLGITNKVSSIYRNTSKAYANFDFVARVKRTGSGLNIITVRMGDKFDSVNLGYRGYLFGYANWGEFNVYKIDGNGVLFRIQEWTPTEAIVMNGWNVLRVVAIGNHFTFYINGFPVLDFVDTMAETGSVGFAMYKNQQMPPSSRWIMPTCALLFAHDARPVAISPEQQALNEAAMNDGVGGSLFSPPNKYTSDSTRVE